MLKFWILWGKEPDDHREPETYAFDTEAEAKAFWRGVSDAEGWEGMSLFNEDGEIVAEGEIQEIAHFCLTAA